MDSIINYFTNIPRNKLIKRLVVVFILLALAVGLILYAWDYFITQKVVTLNPSAGTTIEFGTRNGDEPIITNPIATTTTLKTIRLRPGSYVVRFSGSKDYQEIFQPVVIDKSVEIKTPTLSYTNEKLSQLLESEKPAIQQVLSPYMPDSGYTVDSESLFNTGAWYGARLIPSGWYDPTVPADLIPRPTNINNTQDMLKVIMKKGNGVWKVVAGPSIVISIADYSDIPQDVIRATNKLGLH